MVAVLMQQRLAIRPPISFARDLATAVKNINDPVDPGFSFEGRFAGGIEVSFFKLTPIRIVFSADDGVAARDNVRFAIDTYESSSDFIASFIILRFPGVVSVFVKERFSVHSMIALAGLSPSPIIRRRHRRVTGSHQGRFAIQSEVGGSDVISALVVLQATGMVTVAVQEQLLVDAFVGDAGMLDVGWLGL